MDTADVFFFPGFLLLGVVILQFARYFWNARRLWRRLKHFPTPKPWPLFGNVNEMGFLNSTRKLFNPLAIFMQTRTGLGEIFRKEGQYCIWIGWRPVIVLFGAETVEPLLRSNTLLDKGEFYRLFEPWLGKGLLTSNGDTWRRHRKLLTPTFHFRILDNFLTVMNEQSAILIQKLSAASQENTWVDVLHYLSMCALDIICETAMGIRMGAQEDKDSSYVKAVQEFLTLNAARGSRPWLRFNTIFAMTERGKKCKEYLKTLHDFTESVIRERRAERKSSSNTADDFDPEATGTKKKLAFLDLLLEMAETGEFNTQEIRQQVDTFMFAGHDTTSTALSWVFYLLGLNPEIQSRLLEEVDQVFGDDKDRPVTQEDMKQLKYMDCVMKEGQRVYPSVPGFGRQLTEDITTTGGHVIPKGITVSVNTYLVHHDPKVYPNPEIFDPDRFLPENSIGRHPYAFIPFSAGARNCIGQRYALMEEKVVLCHVLRHFRVTSLDPRDKILLVPAAVLRTDGPLRVTFHPR